VNSHPRGPPLGPEGFTKLTKVSRETLERLSAYVDLLKAWNRRINLVGPNTIGDVWRRHILDSAQLYPEIPRQSQVIVDLGSGAGLPGLVLSILGVGGVHLIEADQRKVVFLREAIRATGAEAIVHARRIEDLRAFPAEIVTARALAPLPRLLESAKPFLAPSTICLFLKGQSVAEELTLAAKEWRMTAHRLRSLSDPTGCMLRLENISFEHSTSSTGGSTG
jgi:16S rRNA (guanine527-N7)-methyltransferase